MKNIKPLSRSNALKISGGSCVCYQTQSSSQTKRMSENAENCFNICCQTRNWGWGYLFNRNLDVTKVPCSEGAQKARDADFAEGISAF